MTTRQNWKLKKKNGWGKEYMWTTLKFKRNGKGAGLVQREETQNQTPCFAAIGSTKDLH